MIWRQFGYKVKQNYTKRVSVRGYKKGIETAFDLITGHIAMAFGEKPEVMISTNTASGQVVISARWGLSDKKKHEFDNAHTSSYPCKNHAFATFDYAKAAQEFIGSMQ